MKLTIVPFDQLVIVDGVPRQVLMDGVDPAIHAIQWNGTDGEIEYSLPTPRNQKLTTIVEYQFLIDRWTAAAPPPAGPPVPPTKDEWIDAAFSNPAVRAMVLELVTRSGLPNETAIRAAIKARMP